MSRKKINRTTENSNEDVDLAEWNRKLQELGYGAQPQDSPEIDVDVKQEKKKCIRSRSRSRSKSYSRSCSRSRSPSPSQSLRSRSRSPKSPPSRFGTTAAIDTPSILDLLQTPP